MIRWEAKRPIAVRDYTHDWSPFLGADTIASSVWTSDDVTIDDDDVINDDTGVKVWLSGGTTGTTSRLTNVITTVGGRTEPAVFALFVSNFEEPVSLAEAKAQIGLLDDTSRDTLITSYITAAREYVEGYTGHILVRRPLTQTFDSFTRYLELNKRPVVSIDEIAYLDTDGAEQEFADYFTTNGRFPLWIFPNAGSYWPSIQTNSTITVTYTAGYAEGEVPQALCQAILLLVGGWFESRTAATERPQQEIPFAVTMLLDQYRTPGL